MKYLLVLTLAAVPFLTRAQDSCKLKKQTDAFTKQTKITTGFVSFTVDGSQLNVSIDATSTEIDFFFWFKNDTRCFDDQSSVQVNYDGDKLKTNFKNTGSMNCEGAFHFTFKNSETTPSNLARFTDKRVSSVKFTSTDKKTVEIKFTEEQKQLFQRMVSCVVREAKSLIKK
jgi:hypothetical protein